MSGRVPTVEIGCRVWLESGEAAASCVQLLGAPAVIFFIVRFVVDPNVGVGLGEPAGTFGAGRRKIGARNVEIFVVIVAMNEVMVVTILVEVERRLGVGLSGSGLRLGSIWVGLERSRSKFGCGLKRPGEPSREIFGPDSEGFLWNLEDFGDGTVVFFWILGESDEISLGLARAIAGIRVRRFLGNCLG